MNPREINKKMAWKEFLRGETHLKSLPFRASIEITRNCDLRCVMCSHSRDSEYSRPRPELDMTPELFKKTARELFPFLEQAHLQGFGETVVSPHWPEILELCRPYSKEVKFTIVTNLNRKDDAMWRKMVEMGFQITFSCDGATAGTFEGIRRGARFDRVMENLEVVKKARDANPSGPELCLLVTLQPRNYREMPLFTDLAARYGAESVVFSNTQGTSGRLRRGIIEPVRRAALALCGKSPGENLCLYDMPGEEISGLKEETMRAAAGSGVKVTFLDNFFRREFKKTGAPDSRPVPLPEDFAAGIADSCNVAGYKKCFKPFSYIVVNHKGDVGLCNHLLADGKWEQMGNIAASGIEEIWNSPEYRGMRVRHLTAAPKNRSCKWCYSHRTAE